MNRRDYLGRISVGVFDYEDPDGQPGGAVAMISVDVTGKNLCSCSEDGKLIIHVQVAVTGTWGQDQVAAFGQIAVDGGNREKFVNNPAIGGGESTFEVPVGRCGSGTGNTLFRILDQLRSIPKNKDVGIEIVINWEYWCVNYMPMGCHLMLPLTAKARMTQSYTNPDLQGNGGNSMNPPKL